MPRNRQIQVRRDTAANWTSENPILASGEIGFEIDTASVKYGDGTTDWNSLGYFSGGSGATPDATSSVKGKIKLAGDLGGSAALPLVKRAYTKLIAPISSGFIADYYTDGTNDEAQFNAASVDVNALGGGIVQVLPGAYYFDSYVTALNGVWVRGSGWMSTVLYGTSALTGSGLFTNPAHPGDITNAANLLSDFKISDLKINGVNMPNVANAALKGIQLFWTLRCQIENVYVINTPATGIALDFPQQSSVRGCIVENAGRSAGGITFGFNGYGMGTNVDSNYEESLIWSDCYAIGCGDNGFLVECQGSENSSTLPTAPRNYQFINCYAWDNVNAGFGIRGCAGTTLMGCKSFDNGGSGINFEEFNNRGIYDNSVIGCESYNNGAHGIRCSATDIEDGKNFICIGNRVWGNGTDATTGGYGILLGANRAQIKDNIVYGNNGSGITYHPQPDTAHGSGGFLPADPGPAVAVKIVGNTVYNNGQPNYTAISDGSDKREGINILCGSAYIDGITILDNDVYDDQVTPTQNYGIYIEGPVYNAHINDNRVYRNLRTGIYYHASNATTAFDNYNVRISRNTCYNNGQATVSNERSGIVVRTNNSSTLTDLYVHDNRCYDNQGTKTQQYGLVMENSITNAKIYENDLRGNLTSAISYTLTGTGNDSTFEFRNNAGVSDIVTKTVNYTLISMDKVILADTSGGNKTMTLPTAVNRDGRKFTVKKISASNTLTVATTSSQTIDGSSTATATVNNTSLDFLSDGSNWRVI